MRRVVIILIEIYQFFSKYLLPNSCRFTPTCSEYTKIAVLKYGVPKGVWLGMKRIMRCHPFSKGGYDPVP